MSDSEEIRLDSVQIGVPDLDAGAEAYATLLGFPGRALTDRVRFDLQRGAIEVLAGEPGVRSVTFVGPRPEGMDAPDAFRGIDVRFEAQSRGESPGERANDVVAAIDHAVVMSGSIAETVALWRDRVGIRLAFDKEFPERKLRLVFFRSGGITLEIAGPLPAPAKPGPDAYYGVSYRVTDLASCRERLRGAGLDVSDIRKGFKKGTSVATVRDGTEGVPTLLIEHLPNF